MTEENARRLVGCWHLVSADAALGMGEPVEMTFAPTGELHYAVNAGDRWQIIHLDYNVDGEYLITDQRRSPRKERTRFWFEDGDSLVLQYGEGIARFVRGRRQSPDA